MKAKLKLSPFFQSIFKFLAGLILILRGMIFVNSVQIDITSPIKIGNKQWLTS